MNFRVNNSSPFLIFSISGSWFVYDCPMFYIYALLHLSILQILVYEKNVLQEVDCGMIIENIQIDMSDWRQGDNADLHFLK